MICQVPHRDTWLARTWRLSYPVLPTAQFLNRCAEKPIFSLPLIMAIFFRDDAPKLLDPKDYLTFTPIQYDFPVVFSNSTIAARVTSVCIPATPPWIPACTQPTTIRLCWVGLRILVTPYKHSLTLSMEVWKIRPCTHVDCPVISNLSSIVSTHT